MEDMVMEIISKLPSKSLMRFKSVCKPWCSLFSTSHFMTKHLLPDRDTGDLLLVKRRDKTNREYVLSVLSDDTLIVDHSHSLLLPPYPTNKTRYYYSEIKILGYCCCNGYICLFYRLSVPHIVLWSPFVGDIKILPPCDVPYPQGGTSYNPMSELGFGYDADSQDYKVIIVTSWTIDDMTFDSYKFDIYSSKTDSWRVHVYRDLPAVMFPSNSRSGVYTNGVFSWWAIHQNQGDHILWFRMSDESIGTTRLPPNKDDNGLDYWVELLVLNDRFGVIMSNWNREIEKCFHVWALLEFGVEDSWTRLFTLGPLTGITRAVRFWKNGEIIMEDNEGDLVLCDPFSQEIKSLNIGGLANNESDIQIVSIPAKYVS